MNRTITKQVYGGEVETLSTACCEPALFVVEVSGKDDAFPIYLTPDQYRQHIVNCLLEWQASGRSVGDIVASAGVVA